MPLPAVDYRVYQSAARILRRIMRNQAPAVLALVQAKLLRQDATGLVEDYLDLVGWPHASRRAVLPRLAKGPDRLPLRLLPKIRMTRPKLSRLPRRPRRPRPPCDPSRN